jgi:hypothetical protein
MGFRQRILKRRESPPAFMLLPLSGSEKASKHLWLIDGGSDGRIGSRKRVEAILSVFGFDVG